MAKDISCIWCRNPSPEPCLEEIILASLGGPYGCIFRNGEVCRPCNNGFGHLDQAVADELDLRAFEMGVPRRDSRPPDVKNRGNMRAYLNPDGPVIAVNMENHEVTTPDGVRLAPWRGGKRNIRATMETRGAEATLTYSARIGENPKFARGMHKMAFELLAFQIGPKSVMGEEYNPVRAFVKEGTGKRHVLLSLNPQSLVHIEPPFTYNRGGYCMRFCVVGVDFAVDLTPTQEALPKLIEQLMSKYGADGWMCCPPWAP